MLPPLVACAAIAAATSRVRFGPHVGLVGYSPGVSTADFGRSGLERQIARLRELAGPRFEELELHVLVRDRPGLAPAEAFVPVLELLARG
jgi:hypothetical protein